MKEQQTQTDRDQEQAALDRENAVREQEALKKLNYNAPISQCGDVTATYICRAKIH